MNEKKKNKKKEGVANITSLSSPGKYFKGKDLFLINQTQRKWVFEILN